MSLRARLAIVLVVVLVAYAAAAVVIVSTQRALLMEQVDERLTSIAPNAFMALAEPRPGNVPEHEPVVAALPGAAFSDIYVGVVEPNGAISSLLVGGGLDGRPDIQAAVSAVEGSGGIATIGSLDGDVRYRARVLQQPETGAWLVAAQPLDEVDASLARLTGTLWAAGGVIAIGLGLAFFWIQRLGLRPIARVTATAEAIAAGDRSRRAEVEDERTEAGKLGRAFNVMLDERDAVETRLRQFVADASHELRTPLTSVRGYLELYRQGAFREPGELDDVVRRLSAEATRMHGLVEDLLALASLDEGRSLEMGPVDVGQILQDIAQDARAAQPARELAVDTSAGEVSARADETLLIQLVGILVANALAHTPVSAAVSLAARRDAGEVTITVADRGPGLEPEVAARVFDRFWRGETSRARRTGGPTGGTGLGLAIARSITEAHGGTITLDTAPGEGCIFTVRLPGREGSA